MPTKEKLTLFLLLYSRLQKNTALELRPALVVEVEARKTGMLVRRRERWTKRIGSFSLFGKQT